MDPQTVSKSEFAASEKVTSSLVVHELSFDGGVLDAQCLAKSEIVLSKHRAAQEEKAESICDGLPTELKRIISFWDKGAFSWLSVLPVEEHGFALHESAFRDAIYLRYGWLPSGLPAHCVCDQGFSVNHAMNCPTGAGYPLQHNESCDFV